MTEIGVMAPFVDGLVTSGSNLADFAATAEACGVESVWTVEHVVVAEEYEPRYPYSPQGRMASAVGTVPMPDPLELLAYLAAASPTLTLGTSVVVAPLHSPVVLAKRAATLDRLSGGRLRLGLGIGWQKEEYEAVGVPYRERGRRLEECIEVMRTLWAGGPASHEGRFTSFHRVHSLPGPTEGAVPIVLGGHSEAAVRRAGRLGDGWFPYTITAELFEERVALLRASAVAAGRNPDDIEITVWPGSCDPDAEADPAWVRRFVDAGASRLVVAPRITRPADLDALAERLERYRTAVIDRL